VLFAGAGHGLAHGLRVLGLGRGAEALVPACHHGHEVDALLEAGIGCQFYGPDVSLEPDEAELEALLGPRVRALYLTHHLGFPQDGPRWRRFCDRHSLVLIEDVSRAWLASFGGRPVGSFGDLAIFSLNETFGLPDCAALLVRPKASDPDLARLSQRESRPPRPARESALLAAIAAAVRRGPDSRREALTLGGPGGSPSPASLFLMPRVVDEGAAARRRANYLMLLDELADLVPPPFNRLPEGASPFAFPVETNAKSDLLERLARRGVRGYEPWSAPHPAVTSGRFREGAARRHRVVGLPVHQELHLGDVEHVAKSVRGRPPSSPPLRIEPLPSLESVREKWNELAARSSGNVFATWEWNSIWWRHFGEGRRLLATACRAADGSLIAVLPLYLWSARPLRVVRFLGHGAGNELGPISSPGARTAAARALRSTLAMLRCDVFFGEELPADDGWPALLGAKVHRRIGDPMIRLDAKSWDDFLASRSSNLRQQVRRRERNLARDHELRYRLAEDPDRLDQDLDVLFRLHRARWGARKSSFAAAEAFHREFAARAFERGWLRLWFLELDGRPVAAWHGFRFGGIESYYQAGRDPGWTDTPVGFVLLAHSIREALADGMQCYRLGRGATAYKSRFASEDPGLETVVLPRTALGGVGVLTGNIARSVRPLKNALKQPLDI
jgi:CelD/BcsL family acetyltransferase involved in cellulose biosynthesis